MNISKKKKNLPNLRRVKTKESVELDEGKEVKTEAAKKEFIKKLCIF